MVHSAAIWNVVLKVWSAEKIKNKQVAFLPEFETM